MEAILGGVASAFIGSILSDDGGAGAAAARASDASGAAALQMSGIASDQWNYFKENFQPLETGMITEAKAAGSPAEQEQAAGEAHADVTQAFSRDRGTFNRTMAAYGINPASGRFADANLKLNLGEAKADAWAQNQARKGIRDLAFGKKLDVMGLGRNIPATSSATLGAAAATGSEMARTGVLRGAYAQKQNDRLIGPIQSAAQKGIQAWFDTPDTYDSFTSRAAANGFDFVNWGDNYG